MTTGFFFTVSGSNIGSGVTSLDRAGRYVGVGTTALDNIYEVSHHVESQLLDMEPIKQN